MTTLIQKANAGVFYGGATSSDGCYGALQSATPPNDNKIDKDGYVKFINELSDYAFTSFQYSEEFDEWGQYPVTTFDELPTTIKKEFYTHACGGPYVICENAFLYTDGMDGDGSTVIDPQQVVYLSAVCKGVEDAIKEAIPTPPPLPTTSLAPTPFSPVYTAMPSYTTTFENDGTFTGRLSLQLTYQAAVSLSITLQDLQMANSTTRAQLLDAMTSWSRATARRLSYGRGDHRRRTRLLQKQRSLAGRNLSVYPEPLVEANGTSLMNVVEVGE